MYSFGKSSTACLTTCEPLLVAVATRALGYGVMDFGIVYGYRGERLQNRLNRDGASKVVYPDSYHNKNPSQALDAVPYVPGIGRITGHPTQIWGIAASTHKSQKVVGQQVFAMFGRMAGLFEAASKELDIPITWGNDWDSDGSVFDTGFADLGHFQLK